MSEAAPQTLASGLVPNSISQDFVPNLPTTFHKSQLDYLVLNSITYSQKALHSVRPTRCTTRPPISSNGRGPASNADSDSGSFAELTAEPDVRSPRSWSRTAIVKIATTSP